MNDFYFTSKDIYPKLELESKKSFDKVYEFWNKYSSAKHYLAINFFNIEELLSIIEMNSFLTNSRNNLKKHLLHFIKKVIDWKTPNINSEINNYNVYFDFICNIFNVVYKLDYAYSTVKDQNNSLITLNYDLLIENILEYFNRINFNKSFLPHNKYFNFGINYGDNIS